MTEREPRTYVMTRHEILNEETGRYEFEYIRLAWGRGYDSVSGKPVHNCVISREDGVEGARDLYKNLLFFNQNEFKLSDELVPGQSAHRKLQKITGASEELRDAFMVEYHRDRRARQRQKDEVWSNNEEENTWTNDKE